MEPVPRPGPCTEDSWWPLRCGLHADCIAFTTRKTRCRTSLEFNSKTPQTSFPNCIEESAKSTCLSPCFSFSVKKPHQGKAEQETRGRQVRLKLKQHHGNRQVGSALPPAGVPSEKDHGEKGQ